MYIYIYIHIYIYTYIFILFIRWPVINERAFKASSFTKLL